MRLLIITLLVLTLSGCSGLLARTGENPQTGKPLAGLNHATENALSCSLVVLYEFFPALIVTIPVGLVDMATSFVTDIVLLPIDLIVDEPKHSKAELCEIKWGP
jgi:uncharacterized protein YceK